MFGGGRQYFMPNDTADPEYPDKKGCREDGKNLIKVAGQLSNFKNQAPPGGGAFQFSLFVFLALVLLRKIWETVFPMMTHWIA